ncbi:Hypothetical_protein [Hexamita inflata]|uniref:Hypothetical_protein n=1 Tax=Hexamita inflata TaxID=28002 RepID=A0ABP1HT54_9EUKA
MGMQFQIQFQHHLGFQQYFRIYCIHKKKQQKTTKQKTIENINNLIKNCFLKSTTRIVPYCYNYLNTFFNIIQESEQGSLPKQIGKLHQFVPNVISKYRNACNSNEDIENTGRNAHVYQVGISQ